MYRNNTKVVTALLDKLKPNLSDAVLHQVAEGACVMGSVEHLLLAKDQILASPQKDALLEHAIHLTHDPKFIEGVFANFDIQAQHTFKAITWDIYEDDAKSLKEAESCWSELVKKGIIMQDHQDAFMEALMGAPRKISAHTVSWLTNKGFKIPTQVKGKPIIELFLDHNRANDLVPVIAEFRREMAETDITQGVPPRLTEIQTVLADYDKALAAI
jgi:hypothetical protein